MSDTLLVVLALASAVFAWLCSQKGRATDRRARPLVKIDRPNPSILRRPVKSYDHAAKELEAEQGEWYVNLVLERELAELYRYYSKKTSKINEEDSDSSSQGGSGSETEEETGTEEGSETESSDSFSQGSSETSEDSETDNAASATGLAASSRASASSLRKQSKRPMHKLKKAGNARAARGAYRAYPKETRAEGGRKGATAGTGQDQVMSWPLAAFCTHGI
jgi:hypothetical protein